MIYNKSPQVGVVPRKGRLEEIFSKALHSADDPNLYHVSYRDLESIVEVSLPVFVALSENFLVIPASRIVSVRRSDQILYQKHRPSLR
jgi:uncharacterized protein (UPF0248 family)